MTLTRRILEKARELGFGAAGVAAVRPLPHGDAFRQWLEADYHGTMGYMARHRARDLPERLLDGARSIVSVAMNIRPEAAERKVVGKIAAYARGYDYHRVLEHKLSELAELVRREVGHAVRARSAVDRLPLLERDAAFVAGIGWVGKNTMLMNRQQGSTLLLGELLLDVELEANERLPRDYCGSCTACLDVCPTGAFVAPRVLDARRCISYLNIEVRGSIPRDLRALVGEHLFGCDLCQDVCPWNNHAAGEYTEEFAFLGRPEILGTSAEEFLEMDELTFRDRTVLSPLHRARRSGMARNAAVVLGNDGDPRWVDTLAARLEREPDPTVRGHVAWALGAIGGRRAKAALERRLASEQDGEVLVEMKLALTMMEEAR